MFIEQPPSWYRRLYPGVTFRMPPAEVMPGSVYLTFDDGPIPEVTPWVLDVLDNFGAKATFFMVGQNIERNPGLLREVVDRGHRVGNHSLHHIRGLRIPPEEYLWDVDACEIFTGSRLFRPPHGYLTRRQLRLLKENYRIIMHDVVTRDYSKRVSATEIVKNVKKYTRDGSIIVFHDSLKSIGKLRTALPESLEWLKNMGFNFGLL